MNTVFYFDIFLEASVQSPSEKDISFNDIRNAIIHRVQNATDEDLQEMMELGHDAEIPGTDEES